MKKTLGIAGIALVVVSIFLVQQGIDSDWFLQEPGRNAESRRTASLENDGNANTLPFSIYWPPQPPELGALRGEAPLLNGQLLVDLDAEGQLVLQLKLDRPTTEKDRANWNSRLAFNNLGWMNNVKVWDADHRWLWPNLPFLLKLPGEYREQRYGGVDPVKGVDNDFAAVLIRTYDFEDKETATVDGPLVSANWNGSPVPTKQDKTTVEHQAFSDRFTIRLRDVRPTVRMDGASHAVDRIRIWLIFADFLNSKPPPTWPKQPEWAGGILAYFDLQLLPGESNGSPAKIQWSIKHQTPPFSTQFDWGHWVFYENGYSHAADQAELGD